MTLHTMFQRTDYHASPSTKGEWFVATNALKHKSLEELDIPTATGAIVLGCRKGFWNPQLGMQDIEIFLWGADADLTAAQQKYKLQPLVDRQLDCPEIYWG